MTRINAHIQPADLIDKHLLAEYREIVRIPNTLRKKQFAVDLSKIPSQFVLGTGHVTYFYNKIKYLHDRFLSIKAELSIRGVTTTIDDSCFKDVPIHLYNDLSVDDKEYASNIVRERIVEAVLRGKTQPKINGVPQAHIHYITNLRIKYGK